MKTIPRQISECFQRCLQSQAKQNKASPSPSDGIQSLSWDNIKLITELLPIKSALRFSGTSTKIRDAVAYAIPLQDITEILNQSSSQFNLKLDAFLKKNNSHINNTLIWKAENIPDNGKEMSIISNYFLQQNNPNEALRVANLIHSLGAKSLAINNVSNHFLQRNNPNEALRIANLIPSEITKNLAIKNVSNHFLQRNNPNEALRVANLIPSEITRNLVIGNIIRHHEAQLTIQNH